MEVALLSSVEDYVFMYPLFPGDRAEYEIRCMSLVNLRACAQISGYISSTSVQYVSTL